MKHFCRSIVVAFILLLLAGGVRAADVFRYPEAKHGAGELRYVHDIPVATLAGSPKEIGEQWGALVLKSAWKLTDSLDEFLDRYHWRSLYQIVKRTGNVFLPQFPASDVEEIDAAVKSSGWPREFLTLANTALDMRRIFACSALIVEGNRSK